MSSPTSDLPTPLPVIRAEALAPLTHGFFTRQGGVSGGIYASLNCGPGSRDAPEAVAENRARVAAALGLTPGAPGQLVSLHQVHSARVVTVGAPQTGPRPEADALVTATPGLALGVLTADCQPVLFADPIAGVVGAAHAGWRGALGGVLEATVAAMESLGAKPGQITAVIGPTISQRAYEVGPEFFDRFQAEDSESPRYFAGGVGDRLMFDLVGYALARLRAMNLAEAAWTGHCTHSDPERFFSYRRTTQKGEPDYGRQISAIRL